MSVWNGKVYFIWPSRGTIYEVDETAVGVSNIVVLPDGTELGLTWDKKNRLDVVRVSSRSRNAALNYQATKVFDFDKASDVFEGDWGLLLWKINAAANVNTLFHVYLTPEEYQRLTVDDMKGFEELKSRISPRAASLVHLYEKDYMSDDKRPVLHLYRMGMCP